MSKKLATMALMGAAGLASLGIGGCASVPSQPKSSTGHIWTADNLPKGYQRDRHLIDGQYVDFVAGRYGDWKIIRYNNGTMTWFSNDRNASGQIDTDRGSCEERREKGVPNPVADKDMTKNWPKGHLKYVMEIDSHNGVISSRYMDYGSGKDNMFNPVNIWRYMVDSHIFHDLQRKMQSRQHVVGK